MDVFLTFCIRNSVFAIPVTAEPRRDENVDIGTLAKLVKQVRVVFRDERPQICVFTLLVGTRFAKRPWNDAVSMRQTRRLQ